MDRKIRNGKRRIDWNITNQPGINQFGPVAFGLRLRGRRVVFGYGAVRSIETVVAL